MISLYPYDLPLSRPFTSSKGQFSNRKGILVSVQAGEFVGYGEAAPLPGLSVESLDEVHSELSRVQDHNDPLPKAIEQIGPWVEDKCRTASGQHALATAILDAMGQWSKRPISQLLNRNARKEIPISHLYSNDDALFHATVLGTQLVKIKVGSASLEEDLVRIAHIRDIVGPNIPFRADANGAWTPAEAERAIEKMKPLGVLSIEEPLANRNIQAMGQLRGQGVRIAADESVRSPSDLTQIIEHQAADDIVIKPMLIGTPMLAVDMLKQANSAKLGAWVTTTIDGAVGRMMAVHVAAAAPMKNLLPCGLNTAGWMKSDFGKTPEMVGSHINAPTAPGLGIEVTP